MDNKDNKNNIINFNNFNINNNNNEIKSNTNNNYNINNYINNNININLINNNIINSTLKHSFLKKSIINNNYNINIHSLRLSYQKKENKFLIKTKQKIDPKKSNSAKVKSLKEKYRNSINFYSNTVNKISLEDEEEESITSEKESDNNSSNEFLSPQIAHKKKDSKIIPTITPTKEEIFSKAIKSILSNENNEFKKPNNKKNNSINKYKVNKKISNNNLTQTKSIALNADKLKKKRSSLCPRLNFQYKNKNKHVTFTQKSSEKIEENEIKNDIINNNNENNIRRVKVFENND